MSGKAAPLLQSHFKPLGTLFKNLYLFFYLYDWYRQKTFDIIFCRSLFMTEDYELLVNGGKMKAVYKGGQFYAVNAHGQADMSRPIEEDTIQEKTFLKSCIPQAPVAGYTGRGDNYSKVSLEWLKWVEHSLGRPLQTALSDEGEYEIVTEGRKYRVDGYDEETGTVYEFNGWV